MPEHYNAGDRMPEGVLLVDATTGLPIPTDALGGVTLAELLGAVLPVSPNVACGSGAVDANPAMLHYAVATDYAARWPDLTPPTLAECEAFCAGASLSSPITDTTAT